MTAVRGRRVDDPSALSAAIVDLLDPHVPALAGADRIAVVPDAHYPFHPSTGMVTDPAVVEAVLGVLERETTADTAVVGRSGDAIDDERAVQYLGYESILETTRADYESLDDADHRQHTEWVDGGTVSVSVPAPLLEGRVVVVPSLRPTVDGPVAGSIRTLGRLLPPEERSVAAAVATTRAVDPVVGMLDATVAYGGEPRAVDALFAGDPPAIDAVGAALLGRDPASDDAITGVADGDLSVSVEGLDLAELRETVPDGDLPPPDDPHPLAAGGYRLYASLSGDAVPPQLDGGS